MKISDSGDCREAKADDLPKIRDPVLGTPTTLFHEGNRHHAFNVYRYQQHGRGII